MSRRSASRSPIAPPRIGAARRRPSSAAAPRWSRTVAAIRRRSTRAWGIEKDAEITPGSQSEQRRGRVSGSRRRQSRVASAQAPNDGLKALGWPKSRRGLAALEVATSTFDRVLRPDLWRPGQTVDQCALNDRSPCRARREHMSLYQLTIEPDTMFERLEAAGKLKCRPPICKARPRDATQDRWASRHAGLRNLEPRPAGRRESRHNSSIGAMANMSASVPARMARRRQGPARIRPSSIPKCGSPAWKPRDNGLGGRIAADRGAGR